MSRRRKLSTAGLILAIGMALAWQFRKPPGEQPNSDQLTDAQRVGQALPDTQTADQALPDTHPQSQAEPDLLAVPTAPDQVAARMASTTEAVDHPSGAKLESFDLANHPAIANMPVEPAGVPTNESQSAPAISPPVYSTADKPSDNSASEWPSELVHVVANGDTLEKLAERYLNDPGRALEIFDLNRDQLTNPHLLPIGVELRVPVEPGRIID